MTPKGKILVVDDDVGVCEAIAAALRVNYDVSIAHTGAAATDAMCGTYFDLILLDYGLPDLFGTDLLRLIKRFFPSTTVVIITGQGSEEVAVKALQGGARDYIRKPIRLPELLGRVDALFAIRRGGVERRLNEFVRVVEGAAPQNADEPHRARSILRAMRYIGSNLQSPIVLEEVARVAGMSKFHFCRRFKAVMGCSFREFLGRARITRAKELLRNRDMSIEEVGREVGFRDPSHFSRTFREFERVLPSEYRRLVLIPQS